MSQAMQIGVIGGGLMGHGIALTFARAGHNVHVFEAGADSRATLPERIAHSLGVLGEDAAGIDKISSRIAVVDTLGLAAEGAGYITEAVPEKLDLKKQIFSELEAAASADCILASNTSVLPITSITEHLQTRSRALGTHWWNPPHMIPLVEVIRTEWTLDAAMENTFDLLSHAGKTPVRVEKDVPGFIGNRLQHALWREAISLVENGICDAEAVDTVIKSSFGRRLAVLGPLENADLVGTDLTLDIHENVLADLEASSGPSPYLQGLVEGGRLGMKSGEGFQKWTQEEADEVRARVARHLTRLETILD